MYSKQMKISWNFKLRNEHLGMQGGNHFQIMSRFILYMFHAMLLSYMGGFLSVFILFMLCLNMVSGCVPCPRHAVQGRSQSCFSAWHGRECSNYVKPAPQWCSHLFWILANWLFSTIFGIWTIVFFSLGFYMDIQNHFSKLKDLITDKRCRVDNISMDQYLK